MLVRRIARPLLAATFVYGGYQSYRNPAPRAKAAAPVVDQLTSLAGKQLPVQLPTDPELWVKINAGVHMGAGGLFALGRFPRFSALALAGSLVPTTYAGHQFWAQDDPQAKAQHTIHFLKNLGLIGGLLIASVDTEGKPSVGYRAKKTAESVVAGAEASYEKASKKAAKAQKKASKQAKSAQKAAKKQAKKVTS